MNDAALPQIRQIAFVLIWACIAFSAHAADEEMLDMDLSSLMDIQITSAGRKEQALSDVPGAVYVIDQKKLQQSGVTSIPEALRMVPGLQVAHINANHWAISSRGFNGTFSNKVLVQIDGRSVYTPSYSGVYWDMQNILLDDVERIEVIRGPGATLWGANAVNGVINIITREASQTQGGLVSLGTGTHERQLANFRIGTKLNANTYARIYATHNDRDSFTNATTGGDGNDDWKNTQAGFRMDGDSGTRHSWTLQGDYYQEKSRQDLILRLIPDPPYNDPIVDQMEVSGGNLLGRWNYRDRDTGTWTAQAYYDFTNRDESYLDQTHHTFDMDLQHRFQPVDRHDVVWGIGYRMVEGDYENSFQVTMNTESETSHLFSGFAQDEITLVDERVWVTLGAKIEHNDYTGVEFQPNLRLLWKPKKGQSLWASVSQAARTPSRMENSGKIKQTVIPFPVYAEISLNGTERYDSEKLTAWETGYRFSPDSDFSLDLALFYNRYTDLQGYSQGSDPYTQYFANNMKGESYGLEFSVQWSPVKWLETEINYSWIKLDIHGDSDHSKTTIEETTPSHQAAIRTGFNLCKGLRLNLWGRYTSQIKFADNLNPSQTDEVIDGFIELDANIQWKLNDKIDILLAGQNLLDGEHKEFIPDGYLATTEVQRSFYAKLTWRF